MNRAFVVGAILIAGLAGPVCRQAPEKDSRAGREAEARAYLQTISLKTLVENAVDQNRASWPADRREMLRSFVRSETRWPELENAVASALVENFTVAEIRALAAFQGSPEGRSILGKLPAYQNAVSPILQTEIQRVLSMADLSRSRLRWDAPIRELTAGPADETLVTDFVFHNKGARPIVLLSIATSCGCTTAELKKTVYQPGERGTLRVVFTKGNRVGLQDERVTVTTNEPDNPSLTLQLRVTIPEALKITPRVLLWKSGQAMTTEPVTMEIPAGAGLEIIGLDSVSEGFIVKTVPDKDRRIVVAQITPRPNVAPSIGKAVFLAAADGGWVIRIPVYLRVLPSGGPGKAENASSWDHILWINVQLPAGETTGFPGALNLSEDSWDAQIEPILARWTPETRIVVFGQPPALAARIAQRLQTFGLGLVHVLTTIQ